MAELLWAGAIALAFAAYATTSLVPWDVLIETGTALMYGCAAVALPVELVYFGLLGHALHHNGSAPAGWYWRSFEHHHLLRPAQRRYVLPLFYTGAVGFGGISLGIGVVLLGFVAATQQG